MKIHFEMDVQNSRVGVMMVKQIHRLTGILPVNVTHYNDLCEMKPIAQLCSDLKAENTKYSHLKIVRKAV